MLSLASGMARTNCAKALFLIGDDAPAPDVLWTDSTTPLVAWDIKLGIGVFDPHVVIVRSVAGIFRVEFYSPRQPRDTERRPLPAAVNLVLLGPSIAPDDNIIERHDNAEVAAQKRSLLATMIRYQECQVLSSGNLAVHVVPVAALAEIVLLLHFGLKGRDGIAKSKKSHEECLGMSWKAW